MASNSQSHERRNQKHDSIYAEFGYIRDKFLNSADSQQYSNICTESNDVMPEILLYQACSLGLDDIVEDIFPMLHTPNGAYQRTKIQYDCLAIALAKKHDNLVRVLLKLKTSEQKPKPCLPKSRTRMTFNGANFTMIHCAALHGDIEIIKLLTNYGVDENQTNDNGGETALHYACNAATAAFLITNGANVNAMNHTNQTPLFAACANYRMGVIRTLLDNGANPNIGSNFIPPDIACDWDSDRSIASALHQCVDQDSSYFDIPLSCIQNVFRSDWIWNTQHRLYCKSCKHENQLLIQEIEVINLERNMTTREYPPLHSAISNYHEKIKETGSANMDEITFLLSKNDSAIVNGLDSSGVTALYHAVTRNLIEIATLLLDSGADPNLTTSGRYPLVVACRYLSYEFVELLLTRGADPNVVDCYKKIPLFIAVTSRDYRLVKLLVEHGADINQEEYGMQAFTSMVDNEQKNLGCTYSAIDCLKIAEYLLDNNFRCNPVQGFDGSYSVLSRITLHLLHGTGATYQLLELLLQRGADISFFNSRSYIFMAIPVLAREYLRRGGDPNQPDGYGRNLLSLALSFSGSGLRCARIWIAAGADPNLVTWDSWVVPSASRFQNLDRIDFMLAIGVKFNVAGKTLMCESYPPEKITIDEFYMPFCGKTACIVRLFKAGCKLNVLATCCRERSHYEVQSSKLTLKEVINDGCSLAGRLCQAVVLAGHNVQQQQHQLIELLRESKQSHARDLGSWLDEDSTKPPSLLRLCRTVIRSQLSVASGYRTILPLIDVLPISNLMRLYLKFEGSFSEIDLEGRGRCESCSAEGRIW